GFRELLEAILSGAGYTVEACVSVADAKRLEAANGYGLVLSDLRLPDGDGLDVVRWFAEQMPGTPVIVITAFGTIDSAVVAVKLGAQNYLTKPLRSPEELRITVRKALEERRTAREFSLLREE